MARYYLNRVGQAVLVLWAAFTLTFIFLQLLPGDGVLIMLEAPELGLSADQIAELRAQYGADKSPVEAYFASLFGVLQGDFGISISTGEPVLTRIAAGLPETAKLAIPAFLLAVLIAVLIATAVSFSRLGSLRATLLTIPVIFSSAPAFWIGILLIQFFSFRLGWVPTIGGSEVQRLILPVITLALPLSAPIALVLCRSVDDVLSQPFVAVATSKGARRGWVLSHHVMRNATLPALTIAGLVFAELIGGAVLTETVFGRNGIGRLTEQAISRQDTAVLQGIVLLAATAFVLINLIVDMLYPLIDPRLKVGARRRRAAVSTGGRA